MLNIFSAVYCYSLVMIMNLVSISLCTADRLFSLDSNLVRISTSLSCIFMVFSSSVEASMCYFRTLFSSISLASKLDFMVRNLEVKSSISFLQLSISSCRL